jgi:hypothetical protein
MWDGMKNRRKNEMKDRKKEGKKPGEENKEKTISNKFISRENRDKVHINYIGDGT